MNDGIEPIERINLLGDGFRFSDDGHVADDDCLTTGKSGFQLAGPCLVPRMKDNTVPLLEQQLCCEEAESIR